MKKSFLLIISLILVFGLAAGCELPSKKGEMKPEEAKEFALDFINSYLISPGNEVTISEIAEQNGVYKITVEFGEGNSADSYLSKDGKLFFPEAFLIDDVKAEQQQQQQQQQQQDQPVTPDQLPKSEKPDVFLYVMSHCPYGTQIEKGIIPVLDLLEDKINFSLKFVDYAMHDKKEIDEQLNQYCIQKEKPDQFMDYLKCFLEDGNTDECFNRVGVAKSDLQTCIDETDKRFKISENYENKETWKGSYPPFNIYAEENTEYGVTGSPALVINEAKVSTDRDPQSLLNAICYGFENLPEECSKQLSTESSAPGFGFEGTGDGTTADCGE